MIDIYGIGNLLIDIVSVATDEELNLLGLHKGTMHLTDDGERSRLVEFLRSKDVSYSCGGDCPNTMIALASFGANACLAGKVGNDDFGKIYQSQLADLPIRSEVKVGAGDTGSSIILVSPDSERTMNTHLGINRQFSFADVDPEIVGESRFLYLTGYLWDTELQKDAILRTLAIAKKSGCRVAFDVADPFAVNRNRPEFLHIIEDYVDVVFANREEACILVDSNEVREAARKLSGLCDVAVVKNGSAGSFVVHGDSLSEIPVCEQKPVDTTGAGDMYAAGFLYGLIKGFPLFNAGVCGSYLASQIIIQHGAQFTPERRVEVAAVVKNGGWDYLR